ncbi:respiratory nitrate reductase chaperone NarJ [Streptomyces sp. BK208]|uniref:nitrate reductase molybdenum cofactor assembly chaperone n=1 Tax=Streptomyces sp. BK208 TaxID=2512150 RepID=UPI0010607A9F|nr:nitrate reductase molybdenum cofactor assembly chaperone [Streptomyces sp. BK208]TDT38012.1 respiratory nitrate reductase chaperone NarJ [Streptomyces sp. BK208]
MSRGNSRTRSSSRGRTGNAAGAPAVFQAAALLLGYPDGDWPRRPRTVREAVAGLPGPEIRLLLSFCDRVEREDPLALAARYVATFDRSRRRCLYLTYYTDGDTRRRGAALARIKAEYRAHGWLPPDDELPDFLPLMLEFAARVPAAGTALLTEHRAAVEVLRYALEAHRSPYADLLRAVCHCLPGPAPASREEALRLTRTGPPAEAVGLDVPSPFPTLPRPHDEGARR